MRVLQQQLFREGLPGRVSDSAGRIPEEKFKITGEGYVKPGTGFPWEKLPGLHKIRRGRSHFSDLLRLIFIPIDF